MKTVAAALLALGMITGCGSKSSQPTDQSDTSEAPAPKAPEQPTQSPADEARTTFNTVCSTCHGADGKGDGPASASLNPKPRNYTDKAWQGSVTDDQIKKTILMGGAAVGKSPIMPAQPQLRDKPEVVDELVKIIRAFGK
ncbi:MAG TPA: c-type cytochrome [Kofleriaceae bacterium]